MKNLKHYFFLSLSIVLILSLSACQKKEDPSSVPDIPESSVAQMESKDLSQEEASKESDSTKEPEESLSEEETSPESMDPSKENEPSKEEEKQDPSKDAKEEEKDLTQAKATPAPTPTASPSTKPTTVPSEKPSASPSVKPSGTPAPAKSPESTPAPTNTPAPTKTPDNTPAPTTTPAPAQSPEHQHNWEFQYLIRADYLGNCMYDYVSMTICYGCGATQEDHHETKIHHQWSEMEVVDDGIPATCTEPGRGGCSIDHNYCDCGERNIDTVYDRRDETYPPLGHAMSSIKTYTGDVKQDENGNYLSYWCKKCLACGIIMDEGWDY